MSLWQDYDGYYENEEAEKRFEDWVRRNQPAEDDEFIDLTKETT